VIANDPYAELERRFARLSAVNRASAILNWDRSTMMPSGASEDRADQLATLGVIAHGMIAAPDMPELLSRAEEGAKGLDRWRAANLREMRRLWVHESALPADLVEARTRAASACEMVWREAKKNADFKSLLPTLGEVLGDAPGEGARQMLDALDVGRVNVACRALGIVDRCLACAVEESTTREVGDGLLGEHTHAQLRIGELVVRRAAVEAMVERAAAAVDAGAEDAREISTAAKVLASDTAVWAVDVAARLAASRSYAAGDELARLRRDAPQTQIGEGANDALLLALGRDAL
jgi:hypothetical protein